ncbi:dirigent protein 22-like [Nymphaea colorata]|nr:dirigent protein 22-like [Nymphaea colorata]
MDNGLLPKSFLFFTLFLFIATTGVAGAKDPGHRLPRPRPLRKEKVTRLRFYWHDVVSGKNPTSITIVQGPSLNYSTGFGSVQMIDNPLTEGPELTSKQVGRCQGIYASASQQDLGLLMSMNLVFTEGRYNGSTLSIIGRNSVFHKLREMPVVGGSGAFRMARGYALLRTHWLDMNTGDASVQYDVVVVHH